MRREKAESWLLYKNLRESDGRNHSRTLAAWDDFRRVNEDILHYAMRSQINYERNICNRIKFEPKLFHSYIKHRKVCKPSIGPLKLADGCMTDSALLMANEFLRCFSSVFSVERLNNPYPHQISVGSMEQIHVTEVCVLDAKYLSNF